MLNTKIAGFVVAAVWTLTGTMAVAQPRYDVRANQQDLRRDYQKADRLRAVVAQDRYHLDQELRRGSRRGIDRAQRQLAKDENALQALMRDIRRDRNGGYANGYWNDDHAYDDRDPRRR